MSYKTNSLQVAAYLATKRGITLAGIDKANSNSILFLFDPADKAAEATQEYYSGKSMVDASELFKNYRMLKDMLFDAKRSGIA